MTIEKDPKRRGVSIYRDADAMSFAEADIMSPHQPASEAVVAGYGEVVEGGLYSGADARVLVRQTPEEGGFSLVRLWFKSDYPLPRHTHNVDCMYYVLSGSAVMGNQTLRTGDSFFVPADAPYRYSAGPEGVEVLEIRGGGARFDMVVLDQSDEQWKAMAETARSSQQVWSEQQESPTAVANRGATV